MNGRDLALGLVAGLALAGVARRRGSASLEAWPNADALARTFTDTMANATAQQMGRWAKKNGLVYIGSGQSRAVFAEPDGTRVLKLVFSFFGQEANRDEARAWREASAAMRPHLVPVLAADPMGSWLVMERVKPLRATQHIPKGTMDALKGCGFLDLRRPNFAADGRLLDYGAMLFWRQEAGCRAEGGAAREGSGSVRPRRHPPIDYDALATAFRDWLKTLSSPMKIKRELPRWAHANGLTYLGSGSQRAVFGVPKGALKIAYNKSGFVANRTEAEVWKDAPADLRQYLVPVVQDSGAGVGEGAWLLMERVICTTHGNMPPETQKRLLDCGINDIVCQNLSDDGRLLDYANVDRKLWAPCATPGTPTSYGALSLREVAPSLIKELSDARRRVEEMSRRPRTSTPVIFKEPL